MADIDFVLNQTPGKSLFLTLTRTVDGYIYDYSDGTFKASPVDAEIPLVESTGTYTVTVDFTSFDDGEYLVECFDTTYGFPYATALTLPVQNGTTLEIDVQNQVGINEDTGGTDNLRYVDPDGDGIEGAVVSVWVSSDYGLPGAVPVGITQTDVAGRWTNQVGVPPGDTYKIVLHKPSYYGPDEATVVV